MKPTSDIKLSISILSELILHRILHHIETVPNSNSIFRKLRNKTQVSEIESFEEDNDEGESIINTHSTVNFTHQPGFGNRNPHSASKSNNQKHAPRKLELWVKFQVFDENNNVFNFNAMLSRQRSRQEGMRMKKCQTTKIFNRNTKIL